MRTGRIPGRRFESIHTIGWFSFRVVVGGVWVFGIIHATSLLTILNNMDKSCREGTYIPSIWRGRSLWSVRLSAEPSGLVCRRPIAAPRPTPTGNRSFVRRFGQPRAALFAPYTWNKKKKRKRYKYDLSNLLYKTTITMIICEQLSFGGQPPKKVWTDFKIKVIPILLIYWDSERFVFITE